MRADTKLSVLIGTGLAIVAGWYFWGSDRPSDAIELGTWQSPVRPEAVSQAPPAMPHLAGPSRVDAPEVKGVVLPGGAADGKRSTDVFGAESGRPAESGFSRSEGEPSISEPMVVVEPVAVSVPREHGPVTHVIESGDNFALLAERYYGSQGQKYVDWIVAANPQVDPMRLRIGQSVIIPATDPAVQAEAVTETEVAGSQVAGSGESSLNRMYRVQTGDNFFLIAKKLCGQGTRWREMYELNLEKVPGGPASLKPGQILRVPDRWITLPQ